MKNQNFLLESLEKKVGKNIPVRRYSLAEIISESYRALYECKQGTNLQRMAESHIEDVRNNPGEIEKLSRKLSIIKELIRLEESREIKDSDLSMNTSKRTRSIKENSGGINHASPLKLKESTSYSWGEWQRPYGSVVPEKYYSRGEDIKDQVIGIIYGNDPESGDPDFSEGYQAEINDPSSGDTIEDFGYDNFDTEEEAKEVIERWFKNSGGINESSSKEGEVDDHHIPPKGKPTGRSRYLASKDNKKVCSKCHKYPCICEAADEDLLEGDLTDEEVEELTKHLEELRKNKKTTINEAVENAYKVYKVCMDVAFPADISPTNYGLNADSRNRKLFNSLADALSQHGLEMAGDMIEADEDLTDIYKDNDYEFFTDSKEITEECSTKNESSGSRNLKKRATLIDETLETGKTDTRESSVLDNVFSWLRDQYDEEEFKRICKDKFDMTDDELATFCDIYESVENTVDNKGELVDKKDQDTVKTKKMNESWTEDEDKELKKHVDNLVVYTKSHHARSAKRECETIDKLLHDIIADEVNESIKNRKIEEARSYDSNSLKEFSSKSSNKAFYKTFKKMKDSLKEGKALTRQESINLYKAANSALTHLSVELEHNPGFLSTFNEATTLLTTDVNKLLESMKNGKAPSKKTMKSLAKFSEALLNESANSKKYAIYTYDPENGPSPDDCEPADEFEAANDEEAEKYFEEWKKQYMKNASLGTIKESATPNEYSKKFKIGDKVRFKHAGGKLSPEVATITGYDDDGFYKYEWDDGEKSNGSGDPNFVLAESEEEDLPPIEDEENDSAESEEVSEESAEEEDFDQEYADARFETHKDMVDKHENTGDPAIQDKIVQDAEEVAALPGLTDDQKDELDAMHTPDEEDAEPSEEDSPEEDPEEDSAPEDDISTDELEELKNHLREMRKAKMLQSSKK